MMEERKPLLEVRHLKKYFGLGGKKELKAVDDVSFDCKYMILLRKECRFIIWYHPKRRKRRWYRGFCVRWD